MGTSSQWQQLFKYAFNYLRATKGPRMAKSVDDRGRGARLARRDEGAYCWYVTEEHEASFGVRECPLVISCRHPAQVQFRIGQGEAASSCKIFSQFVDVGQAGIETAATGVISSMVD